MDLSLALAPIVLFQLVDLPLNQLQIALEVRFLDFIALILLYNSGIT
jgi:hypothetical protein